MLAVQRQQPGQLLAVLKGAQQDSKDEQVVQSVVAGFTADDVKYTLQTIRDWNTQAKSAHQAQLLLHAIILRHPPQV